MKRLLSLLIIAVISVSMIPLQLSVTSDVYAAGSSFSEDFASFNSNWEYRSGSNGSPFNCVFSPSQVSFKDSKLVLTLDRDYSGSGYPYKGAEYRTSNVYGYGYYETKMKPAKNTGIVSSFFTYTGPSDGNPWDEIDIEFLGKDTTKVQFNWYKNGKGGHEYYHNLGFDASQGYHTYGFDWQPNSITYYVDGVKVYTGTQEIPTTPGKIMMNLWPGITVDDWLGAYDGKTPLSAYYESVRYSKEGYTGSTSPTPTPTNPSGSGSNFFEDFPSFNSNWEYRTGSNGSPFNCVFSPSQVTFSDSKMILTLDRDNSGSGYPYKGGEYRTTSFYGYGYYETKMKPAKNTGIISSFFTYTGPSDGNPWDEIDIEFVGKDTTKVQFNWFKNGKGGHEYYHNLGFDASQGYHTYGFDWQPNSITYYVDGVKVYTGTQEIPSTPGKIMMNIWPGITVDDWLGAYDGKTPLSAYYEYVRYSKDGYTSLSTPTPTSKPTNTPTNTKKPTSTPTSVKSTGDFNKDGVINMSDVMLLANRFNTTIGNPRYDPTYDLNNDGAISMSDVMIIASKFNTFV